MKIYSTAHLCWVKPEPKLSSEQKAGLDPVSPADAKPRVGGRPMKCRTKVDLLTVCPAVFVFFEGRSKFKIYDRRRIEIGQRS